MEEEEIWKDVVGFEDYFMISSLGNLFSKRTSKLLKKNIHPHGYYTIATRIGGRFGQCFCFKLHRLVAEAFLDAPEDYLVDESEKTFYKKVIVNHKDGNKLNNKVENLEWCSHKENSRHAVDIGLIVHRKGLENPNFKLNKDQVIYILDHYKPRHREFGARALGRKFGVSHEVVSSAYDFYSDGKL